jgi:serine/threonine protein kinase
MLLSPATFLHGRYVIRKVHEQGRENAVYLAYDQSQNVDVAIKENAHSDRAHHDEFELEAALLANLSHPNIPKASDYFVEDGFQFFVMDYIEGVNLQQLMQRRKPSTEEILDWAAQMCDILAYLHSRTPPIIHRDIEPSNIILTAEGRIFLVDFGFAKAYRPGSEGTRITRVKPGILRPTAQMTTEIVDKQMARPVIPLVTDRRSDQYSLAATLYALLTGAPPLDSMERLAGKPKLAPIRPARPDLSPGAEAALFRALSLDQNRRFSVIEDFRAALGA